MYSCFTFVADHLTLFTSCFHSLLNNYQKFYWKFLYCQYSSQYQSFSSVLKKMQVLKKILCINHMDIPKVCNIFNNKATYQKSVAIFQSNRHFCLTAVQECSNTVMSCNLKIMQSLLFYNKQNMTKYENKTFCQEKKYSYASTQNILKLLRWTPAAGKHLESNVQRIIFHMGTTFYNASICGQLSPDMCQYLMHVS